MNLSSEAQEQGLALYFGGVPFVGKGAGVAGAFGTVLPSSASRWPISKKAHRPGPGDRRGQSR